MLSMWKKFVRFHIAYNLIVYNHFQILEALFRLLIGQYIFLSSVEYFPLKIVLTLAVFHVSRKTSSRIYEFTTYVSGSAITIMADFKMFRLIKSTPELFLFFKAMIAFLTVLVVTGFSEKKRFLSFEWFLVWSQTHEIILVGAAAAAPNVTFCSRRHIFQPRELHDSLKFLS